MRLTIIIHGITHLLRTSGRQHQSLHAASIETWTKFYQSDAYTPNLAVNYYNKGALVALCLDLWIRRHAISHRSLDDVLLYLWENYGQHGRCLDEHNALVSAIQAAVGIDCSDFFLQYIEQCHELPLQDLLLDVGIQLQIRPRIHCQDKGQVYGIDQLVPESQSMYRYSGLHLSYDGELPRVKQVDHDSPAHRAGISPDDFVVAVNGYKASEAVINFAMRADVTLPMDLYLFRRNQLHRLSVQTLPWPKDTCDLKLTLEHQAVRSSWLNQAG